MGWCLSLVIAHDVSVYALEGYLVAGEDEANGDVGILSQLRVKRLQWEGV